MRYSFHPEAEAEFGHAIEYYEECEKISVMTLPLKYIQPLREQFLIRKLGQLSKMK